MWVLLITFFLTVIFDLTVAIEVGILLALILFLMRTNEQTHIRTLHTEIDPNEDTDLQLNLDHLTIPDRVEVYEIDGPYFFGIANRFILSGVKTHVLHQLQTGGIEQMMNPENICPNIHVALKRANALLNEMDMDGTDK